MHFPNVFRSCFAVCLISIIYCFSASITDAAERQPPETRIDVGGYKLNSLLLEPRGRPELPPIVFIHGASTSMLDPIYSFRAKLEGRAKLLFVDRPGHGKSDDGGDDTTYPDRQADAIATLMRRRGIEKAVIVSHSLGGAVAAAFAVRHPHMVIGLVFLSPALYPWKGGIAWYEQAAAAPVVGWLFSTVVVPPAGLLELEAATKSVFAPNKRPANYVSRTRAYDAISPATFHRNAVEVIRLRKWAVEASELYPRIKAPTVIITGDADRIVSPEIHSMHLARDVAGAHLVVIHGLGHKSDYVAGDVAMEAIKLVAGRRSHLEEARTRVAAMIASGRSE